MVGYVLSLESTKNIIYVGPTKDFEKKSHLLPNKISTNKNITQF